MHKQAVRDDLVALVAKSTDIDEQTCYNVIMWAFKEALSQTYNCASIEFSGFGSILVSQPKVKKELKYHTGKLVDTPDDVARTEKIEYLKTKIRDNVQSKRNSRGVA